MVNIGSIMWIQILDKFWILSIPVKDMGELASKTILGTAEVGAGRETLLLNARTCRKYDLIYEVSVEIEAIEVVSFQPVQGIFQSLNGTGE
jgi:hypothetical protein